MTDHSDSIIFELMDGREFDASIDCDGDLLIQLTDSERTHAFYIRRADAVRFGDWLKEAPPQ